MWGTGLPDLALPPRIRTRAPPLSGSSTWQATAPPGSRTTPRPGVRPVTVPRGSPARAAWAGSLAPSTSRVRIGAAHRALAAWIAAVTTRPVPVAGAVRTTCSRSACPSPTPRASSTAVMSVSTSSRRRTEPRSCPAAARDHRRARRRGSSVPTTVPTPTSPSDSPRALLGLPHRWTSHPLSSAPWQAQSAAVVPPEPGGAMTSRGTAGSQDQEPRHWRSGRSVTTRGTPLPDPGAWSVPAVPVPPSGWPPVPVVAPVPAEAGKAAVPEESGTPVLPGVPVLLEAPGALVLPGETRALGASVLPGVPGVPVLPGETGVPADASRLGASSCVSGRSTRLSSARPRRVGRGSAHGRHGADQPLAASRTWATTPATCSSVPHQGAWRTSESRSACPPSPPPCPAPATITRPG